nr:MAG TPA: hypothetical protein [Caudoviricetes sp.]
MNKYSYKVGGASYLEVLLNLGVLRYKVTTLYP